MIKEYFDIIELSMANKFSKFKRAKFFQCVLSELIPLKRSFLEISNVVQHGKKA